MNERIVSIDSRLIHQIFVYLFIIFSFPSIRSLSLGKGHNHGTAIFPIKILIALTEAILTLSVSKAVTGAEVDLAIIAAASRVVAFAIF